MSNDYTKAERWMKRQQKALREYVQTEAQEGGLQSNREGIAAYVSGTGHIGMAMGGMGYLANYEGAQGCLRVLDGDPCGFEQIDRACLYNFWFIRILTCAYDADMRPGKQPRVMMETVATCWMHATALGAHTIRNGLSARLTQLVEQRAQSIGGKELSLLGTLVAHFATGHRVDELERAGWSRIGVYAPVATRSLRPEQYGELAEFHIQRVGGSGCAEFHFYPYSLVPFELLAIEKLTGVPIQNQHPLLTSPLARRREVPEIPVPAELAAVIERAKSEFPL